MTEEEKQEKQKQEISPRLTILEFRISKFGDKPTCFRELFLNRFSLQDGESNPSIFKAFFQSIYATMDQDSFVIPSLSTKKGITIDKITDKNSRLNFDSKENIIEGLIVGGIFGRQRRAKKLSNKNDTTDVGTDDVITDNYYMMLYVPLDFYKGYMMLQYYPDANIKNQLEDFFRKQFNAKGFKKTSFSYYYDPDRNNEFIKDCIIDHLTYSTTFLNDDNGDDSLEKMEKDIVLKLEVSSRSDKPISFEGVTDFFKKISKISCNTLLLTSFKKKKVTLKNQITGKQTTFDIDDDAKVRPTIYLYEEIKVTEDGIPDFVELKEFCLKELEKIKKREIPGYESV